MRGTSYAKGHVRRSYDGFIAPDGTVYSNIENLPAFAEAHGIPPKGLVELNAGRVLSYHGWRRISPVRTALRTKLFAFIAPDGTRHENITNLRAFCHEHALDQSYMGAVYSGRQKQHKGWTKG